MKFLGKILALAGGALVVTVTATAQMIDNTQATNTAGAGA